MIEPLKVFSPYDHRHLGDLPYSTEQEINVFLSRAKALNGDLKCVLPLSQRRSVLHKASELLKAKKVEFMECMVAEGGKPVRDSEVEFDRAVLGLEYLAAYLLTMSGREIPMGLNEASGQRRAFTIREPLGTVLAISAFNHPLNLIVHQVAPAFASGCPVLVKPASTTPLTCQKFVDIMHEAGAPKEWLALAIIPASLAEKIARSAQIDHLSFIGSSQVGFSLKSILAPGVSCTLEHGGAAPVIINNDADLAVALPSIIKGGFYHSGQVCVSVQRVLVAESIYPEVKETLCALAESLILGDPSSYKTDLGPIITVGERDRINSWQEEAVKLGARVLSGGKTLDRQFFTPTILENVSPTCKLGSQEAFGPILVLYPFKNMAEAIAQANSLPYLFQAAIFTRDMDTAFFAASRLKGTSVMINDHTAFRVDWMPFGGRQESGEGMGGLVDTMLKLSPEKLLVFKSAGWINH